MIRLVPELPVMHAAAVTKAERRHEVGEVLRAFRRGRGLSMSRAAAHTGAKQTTGTGMIPASSRAIDDRIEASPPVAEPCWIRRRRAVIFPDPGTLAATSRQDIEPKARPELVHQVEPRIDPAAAIAPVPTSCPVNEHGVSPPLKWGFVRRVLERRRATSQRKDVDATGWSAAWAQSFGTFRAWGVPVRVEAGFDCVKSRDTIPPVHVLDWRSR